MLRPLATTMITTPPFPIRRSLGNRRAAAYSPLLAAAALMASAANAAPIVPPTEPAAIIGGGPSQSCAWPSTVFLENCTGTLIHPEIVVYAAHCGADRERVWFGEDISDGPPPVGEGFGVDTEFCMTNPEWETLQQSGPSRAADFAFCKLAKPVLDVPIVPPVMGCETTALLSGAPVTLVGFGGTDQETFGVKFEVETELHYIDDWGAAVIGGDGFSPCAGDSGGPAFIQMPDGTWRSFAIVSGPNFGNCGDAMWFATIHTAVPFIEANSGIDVSVCHHSHGEWNPSPACGGFPTAPGDGEGKTWADGCAGGPVGADPDQTCGPSYDAEGDLAPPASMMLLPEDRARFDTESGQATVVIDVEAEAADAQSGVQAVDLVINGTTVPGGRRFGPPYAWPITLDAGIWEMHVLATDWAGNTAESNSVVIGVNEEPPEPEPEGGSSSGGVDETGTESESGTVVPGTTGADDSTGGEGSTGGGGLLPEPDGCGCRQTSPGGGAWALLMLLGLARRRRRIVAVALPLALLVGCGDDIPGGAESSGNVDPSSTRGTPGTTTMAATTDASIDASTGSSTGPAPMESSSTGPACELGTEACGCLADFSCGPGLGCSLNTCVSCVAGTLNCPCETDGDRVGLCQGDLNCFGGLCVGAQPCPFVNDGRCDEPEGLGTCLEGTDAFDCCAVVADVCEEKSAGGRCPEGSDPDCRDGSESSGSGSSGGSSATGGTGETTGDAPPG